MNRFNYDWSLGNTQFTKDKGTVFSCFSCGGGSTMGYKLAGFDVIGCNEIDKRMMYAYCRNHKPKYPFLEPIQEFKNKQDLPEELYNLDILDGSPPCSSFSTVGNRSKDWGKEKKFKEGQQKQILDTLFFDFIDLAKRLQPKVAIAENVEGLLITEAKKYVIRIYEEFDKAGYYCQHWLLDGSKMGLPQKRKRVFFLCLRKDIATPFLKQVDMFNIKPYINMDFNEKEIPFKDIKEEYTDKAVTGEVLKVLEGAKYGETDLRYSCERLKGKQSLFAYKLVYDDSIIGTITAGDRNIVWGENRFLNKSELLKVGSFPFDYDFVSQEVAYIIGMSVPPVMMAQVATRVWEYWLSKI